MLYRDLLSEWWAAHSVELAPSTCFHREITMRVHVLPALGEIEIEQLTSADIQRFVVGMVAKGIAPSSVRGAVISIIRPALNLAMEAKYINMNPANHVTLPKKVRKEIEVFTAEEVRLLIDIARPDWLADMIILAYRTGMRRGEVYGLKWGDIDLNTRTLTVKRTVAAYKFGLKEIRQPKTVHSNRRISLDDATVNMLQRRLAKALSSEWVFTNRCGALMSPWHMTKYMIWLCKTAGIPHRSFHVFRHTHATMLISAGVNPKIVQERLGHANLSMTLGTYFHYLPSMQAAAVEALNRIE